LADQPELQTTDSSEWSHVKETINMLYLAVCQIEATMSESNKSVETLTSAFTKLASHTIAIGQQAEQLQTTSELSPFKSDLIETTGEMQVNINASIQAFQFYDRICQRLDHIARSLEKMSGLMADGQQLSQPSEWQTLKDYIKGSYTMEAERIMFEYIMRGGSVDEALKIYNHHFEKEKAKSPDADNDEIELF